MHADGNANSYIFTGENNFCKYSPVKLSIQQVSGDMVSVKGMGIVIAKFPVSNNIYMHYTHATIYHKTH